ncbi:MAG TPA: DUF11 domain-containing protein [Chloroflexi bacterium]|nr:DUF11 domain-containing protein [Chloroflexota bacterium]
MKNYIRLFLILGLAFSPLLTLTPSSIHADAPAPPSQQIIVKTRPPLPGELAGAVTLDSILIDCDVQSTTPLFDLSMGDVALKRALGLANVYLVTLAPATDVQKTLDTLAADPAVEYAEPNYVGYGAVLPDDQYFSFQWNLNNTGQSGGTPGADIDAPAAWALTLGDPVTIIAVIDTGADLDHPDLAANLVDGYDFVNDDDEPDDDHEPGHGTHVAGIAAAVTDNGIGMAGVCPNCRVMPLKALNSDNAGFYSDWIDAIEYAVDHGASIINMSLGGTGNSSALHEAVRYAYVAGVPIVASMMNEGDDALFYPAAYTETIAVGATNRYDERWASSNYGDHVDLVAPGSEIYSLRTNDTYFMMHGTSMAAPHVAGVLGLIEALRPGFGVEELRYVLRSTAEDQVGPPNEDKKGWDPYFGAGRLNAALALQAVIPPASVAIEGPAEGFTGQTHTFVAAVDPITVAQPITYVWRATGHAPVTRTGGLSDTLLLAWDAPGAHSVTLAISNFGGAITSAHAITLALPTELTVCPGGGCDFETIQPAVDLLSEGGLIKVATGVYTGVNDRGRLAQAVYVSKTLTIRGGYTDAFTEPPDPQANPTSIDAQGAGRAIYVAGAVSVTVEGLHVTGGDAATLGGGLGGGDVGGGIYAQNANVALRHNRVFGNTARRGGGVYLWESSAAVADNVFSANAARWGAGLYLVASDATLTGNTVVANVSELDGGGLYLDASVAVLHQNTITANQAGGWGGGLYLSGSPAELQSNTIANNSAERHGGGLYLDASDAVLTNNVVVDNQTAGEGGGVYVKQASPRLLHTSIARNLGNSGVYVTGGAVALTNTILVGHTTGITATASDTVTLEATLWGAGDWANGTDYASDGSITVGARNVWGDPAFTAPDAGDYHIAFTSAAINAGIDAGVTTDIDGDVRPVGAGYDLGADENASGAAAVRMSVSAEASFVEAGAPLTYTIRVTNTGDVDLHVVVSDAPPEQVAPTAPQVWTFTLPASGDGWVETRVVTVAAGYTGPLTYTAHVTSAEGAMDTASAVVWAAEHTVHVDPEEGGLLVASGDDGATVTVEIPPGAVSEAVQLTFASLPEVVDPPAAFSFAGQAFALEVYTGGLLQGGVVFHNPVTLTIEYVAADVEGLDEDTLTLRYRNGETWAEDGITVVQRDVDKHRLVTHIEHLTEFALFAQAPQDERYTIYLPLVQR